CTSLVANAGTYAMTLIIGGSDKPKSLCCFKEAVRGIVEQQTVVGCEADKLDACRGRGMSKAYEVVGGCCSKGQGDRSRVTTDKTEGRGSGRRQHRPGMRDV